jgi:hypothetical protein
MPCCLGVFIDNVSKHGVKERETRNGEWVYILYCNEHVNNIAELSRCFLSAGDEPEPPIVLLSAVLQIGTRS